jgi:hypothetical protein
MIDTIFTYTMIALISLILILLAIGWNGGAIPKWIWKKIRKVVRK